MTNLPPITTKSQMYALLTAGKLGNTVPQYMDVNRWKASAEYDLYPVWGVRSLVPGGPCRLFCPRDEVEATVRSFSPHACNISLMLEACRRVHLMAEVFVGDFGLELYGVVDPPKGANWRQIMPSQGRTYRHSHARALLSTFLTPSDREDLDELLGMYPGHVIEFSAVNRPIGMYPHRKMIIWEVRIADGSYEQPVWKQNALPAGDVLSRTGD